MENSNKILDICHPVLSCSDAANFEAEIFKDFPEKQYSAILKAGMSCAREFLREFSPYVKKPNTSILLVCGSGHNGADAAIFAREILMYIKKARNAYSHFSTEEKFCKIAICAPNEEKLKPLAKKALCELEKFLLENEKSFDFSKTNHTWLKKFEKENFDLLIEGASGMNFKPPAKPEFEKTLKSLNKIRATLKISIDLPAGAFDKKLSDSQISPKCEVFKADATYATGIAKRPLFSKTFSQFTGRIRYADIGFFDESEFSNKNKCPRNTAKFKPNQFIIKPNALKFLNAPRKTKTSKRDYGHLFILAGSESYKGAALLNVKAALRSGVGLVTAFVPETCASQMAAAEPSAIWIPCPLNPLGGLSLETLSLIKERAKFASAILAGSGLGNSKETAALVLETLKYFSKIPTVLDADAILKELILSTNARGKEKFLLTPHEGEFLRLLADPNKPANISHKKTFIENDELKNAALSLKASILLKSNVSRLSAGNSQIFYSTQGSPTLSRGGSGDMLAGFAAGLLARSDINLSAPAAGILAAHALGMAAECAENELGQNALSSSDILNYLPKALNLY